jgi:hypothetical protein
MAENESLAQRYSVVLEELRLEAVKQTQRQPEYQHANLEIASTLQQNPTVPQASTYPGQANNMNGPQVPVSLTGDMFSNNSDRTMFGDGQNATTPSSLMADLTSWGGFDSLVFHPSLCCSLSTNQISTGDRRSRWTRFYVHG